METHHIINFIFGGSFAFICQSINPVNPYENITQYCLRLIISLVIGIVSAWISHKFQVTKRPVNKNPDITRINNTDTTSEKK